MLADGSTVRILSLPKERPTRWETSARYVPKREPGEAITSRVQLIGAAITLRNKNPNKPDTPDGDDAAGDP